MASIPLPALHVNPPEQQAGPLQQYAQVLGIKNQMQQQQENQIGLQQKQQALADQQAMTKAMQSWDGKDVNALIPLVMKNGASANAVMGLKSKVLEQQKTYSDIAKNDAETGKNQTEILKAKNDTILGGIQALKDVPDAELPQRVGQTIQQLTQEGVLSPQEAQQASQFGQIQDPAKLRQALDVFAKLHSSQSQQLDLAVKNAQVSKDNAEAAAAGGVDMKQMNDWLAKNPGKGPADYQAFKVNQSRESEIQKETDPRVVASKERIAAANARMEQAIKDGSAADAGKLLANRDVAPSEIQARSNPSFLVKAVNEAKKIDPTFNPQRSEAEFAVAKSPTNVGFFGSAKSLTDKGGTLDQLEAVGKEIPQHDLPVLNTIDDWRKAATGSGPIAKYAATALGVADDYAKVMGGGQGSDTSREQALKLIAPNQSPDQRANSVQGIRGAVGSQQESRMGNNRVLKAMYGNQTESPAPTQAAVPQTHSFSIGAWRQANPKGNPDAAAAAAKAQGYTVVP